MEKQWDKNVVFDGRILDYVYTTEIFETIYWRDNEEDFRNDIVRGVSIPHEHTNEYRFAVKALIAMGEG